MLVVRGLSQAADPAHAGVFWARFRGVALAGLFLEDDAGHVHRQDHPGLNCQHTPPFAVMYFYCQIIYVLNYGLVLMSPS